MNKLKYTIVSIIAVVVAIPVFALGAVSSVDRLTDHIEPLIKTDYIKGSYFNATSTNATSTFSGDIKLSNPYTQSAISGYYGLVIGSDGIVRKAPTFSQLSDVLDNTLSTPPATPDVGDAYIVASSPTGDWAGQANKIATWNGSSWDFYTPVNDDRTTVTTGTNAGNVYAYNGSSWVLVPATTSSYWQLGGNSPSSSQKLGTLNNTDLILIGSSTERGRLLSGGGFIVGGAIPNTVAYTSPKVRRNSGDNSSQTVWYKFATIPATGTSNGPILNISYTGGEYLYNRKVVFNAIVSTREGFSAKITNATVAQAIDASGVVIYKESDNTYSLYIKLTGNKYSAGDVVVQDGGWAASSGVSFLNIVNGTPTNTSTPSGTLVFDSTDTSYYTATTFDYINSRIGIGTTTPGSNLNITTTTGNDILRLERTGSRTWGFNLSSGNFNITDRGATGGSNATYFTVNTAGNVGIGTTSPWAQFSVNPNGISGPAFAIGSSTATNFVVTNSGAVGIGTAAPNASVLLDVSGNVNSTGYYLSGTQTLFTSSQNVNLRAPSGKDIIFQSNGTENMRLNSSGNLAIGTTSPNFVLSIESAAGIGSIKRFAAGAANLSPGFLFTRDRGSVGAGNQVSINAGDWLGKVQFRGYNGTSDLDYGALAFLATDTSGGGRFCFFGQDLATERTCISNNTGNLSVGTTSQTTRLYVEDTNKTLSGTPGNTNATILTSTAQGVDVGGSLGLGGLTDSSGTYRNFGIIAARKTNGSNANTSGYLAFYTNQNAVGLGERMRITDTGNIGIGTSTPGALLDVNGGNMSFGDSANTARTFNWTRNGTVVGNISTNNSVMCLNGGTGSSCHMTLATTGFVGLASTSPWGRLSVNPLATDNNAPAFVIGSSTGTSFIVDSAGQVGVGTSGSLSSTFDVYGPNTRTFFSMRNTSNSNRQVFSLGSNNNDARLTLLDSSGVANVQILGGTTGGLPTYFNAGNVGIGTTTPASKLSVVDSSGNPFSFSNPSSQIFNDIITLSNAAFFDVSNVSGTTFRFRSKPYANLNQNAGVTKTLLAMAGNTGAVGTGTTSPTYPFSVTGFGASTGITFQTTNSSNVPQFNILDNGFVGIGSTTPYGLLSINPNGITGPAFVIGSSTRTLWQTDTTGSTTAANGINITDGCYAINNSCLSIPTGTSGQITYFNGSNTLVGTSSIYISPTTGNVGIGSTNPTYKLEVSGVGVFGGVQSTMPNTGGLYVTGNNPGGDVAGMVLYNAGGGSGASVSVDFYNTTGHSNIPQAKIKALDDGDSSDHLTFLTKTPGGGGNPLVERMRINSSGNVGINTTNPTYKLEVNSSAVIGAGAQSTMPNTGALYLTGNNPSGDVAGLVLYNAGGGGGASVSVDFYNTTGHSNIPQAKIKAIDDGASSDHLIFLTKTPGSGSNPLVEKMRITSSGNVGIGSTTPYGKLSITGTSGSTIPILQVASSTDAALFSIDGNGHITTGGSATSVSSCGSGASVSGNDTSGTVTVGSGVVTACTITYSTAQSASSKVFIETEGGTTFSHSISAKSSTSFTVTFSATIGGGTFDYLVVN